MQNQQWQNLLKEGNEHFYNQQWLSAEMYYIRAYDLLAQAFEQNPHNIKLMMAWICASHNLSSLHEATGHYDNALRFLLAPHEHLKQLSESNHLLETDKVTFVRGMTLTINAIRAFAQKHTICEDCMNLYPSLHAIIQPEIKRIH